MSTENKSSTEQTYTNQRKSTTEKARRISYKTILRTLSSQQHKPIEYTLDYLAKYRLIGINQIVTSVIELTKQGVLKLTKTKNGFMVQLESKESKNKTKDEKAKS